MNYFAIALSTIVSVSPLKAESTCVTLRPTFIYHEDATAIPSGAQVVLKGTAYYSSTYQANMADITWNGVTGITYRGNLSCD